MNHGDTEGTEGTEKTATAQDELTRTVIGAAIEVHRVLGPGLMESIYQAALACELREGDLRIHEQVALPISYKGRELARPFLIDMVVEARLLLEVKAERLTPLCPLCLCG